MSGNTPPGGQPDPQQPYPYGSQQPGGPGQGFGQPSGPGYGPGGYPQQPYGPPGPGGPGQPMGPGGPGQPMGPGGPYGGAPQYGQPPGPRKSNRLWLILGAAVLALIILGVGAGVLINNRSKSAGTDPADPVDPGTTAPVANKPSDAVKAYLEALAAGKAETALALGDTLAADKTFLTDAVLADSNSRAPISEINVPEVTDEYAYNVDATYKMGDEAVSDQFSVKKVGDSWKVRESFVDMNLSSSRSATVPMLINKVAVKTDKIRVFPGSYSFSTGNKNLDYQSTSNTMLVKSLTDYPSMSDIQLGLTDAGLKAFVASAKTQVEACVKQKKLAPSGCPFAVREASYQDIDEDSIEWKLDDDAFANVKPRLDYENPAIVTYSGSIPVIFSAEGEQFDRQATFGPLKVSGYSKLSANMTKEPVKVVFTR